MAVGLVARMVYSKDVIKDDQMVGKQVFYTVAELVFYLAYLLVQNTVVSSGCEQVEMQVGLTDRELDCYLVDVSVDQRDEKTAIEMVFSSVELMAAKLVGSMDEKMVESMVLVVADKKDVHLVCQMAEEQD